MDGCMRVWAHGPEHAEKIRRALTPAKVKSLGRCRKVPIRPDWEEVKEEVMLTALRAKFHQNPELRERLLATGDAELIEPHRGTTIGAREGAAPGGTGSGGCSNKSGRPSAERRRGCLRDQSAPTCRDRARSAAHRECTRTARPALRDAVPAPEQKSRRCAQWSGRRAGRTCRRYSTLPGLPNHRGRRSQSRHTIPRCCCKVRGSDLPRRTGRRCVLARTEALSPQLRRRLRSEHSCSGVSGSDEQTA
jgi:hypothetical protein